MTATRTRSDLEVRANINDALRSYCRGIDRLHPPSIAAAFHTNAVLEGYGAAEQMSIEMFVPKVIASLRAKYVATQHRLSNVTIEIEGDAALVESYVLAYHVAHHDNGRTLSTFNGRYIDRFDVRNGAWRIACRTLRMDWSEVSPLGAQLVGAYVCSGRDGNPDPIFG